MSTTTATSRVSPKPDLSAFDNLLGPAQNSHKQSMNSLQNLGGGITQPMMPRNPMTDLNTQQTSNAARPLSNTDINDLLSWGGIPDLEMQLFGTHVDCATNWYTLLIFYDLLFGKIKSSICGFHATYWNPQQERWSIDHGSFFLHFWSSEPSALSARTWWISFVSFIFINS